MTTTADTGQPTLTPRQTEVLQAAANGLENEQIAQLHNVCDSTVKVELSAAYRRLSARNRAHAVLLALRAGLIT